MMVSDPYTIRILQAWLLSGRTMGSFLTNASLLEGVSIGHLDDAELARVAEAYLSWLIDTGKITV